MRAIQVNQPGGLDNLALVELDQPSPQAGEVLVKWHASSLNYHDLLVALGAIKAENKRIPMSDGAGEVIALGEGVSSWAVGDNVMSLFFRDWHAGDPTPENTAANPGDSCDGCAAEYAVVPANSLTAMPKNYSYTEAATLPCAALTAWRGLMEGGLKAGDRVLVEGTGGMSIFALQFAKAAGATVYATTSSNDKADRLKALGADHVINYKEDPKWGKTVAKMSGGGVEHVLDIGGDSTLDQSIAAAKMGGHIALIGILGGLSASIMLPTMFFKHLKMTGLAVGSKEMQEEMIRAIDANQIKPVIDKSFALDQLADAFAYQQSNQHFGKIVIEY